MSAPERHLVMRAEQDDASAVCDAAAEWLAAGRVVAYPTDTYYGLAVDPGSVEAVDALFALKGRDRTAALPLIAASREQVEEHCGPLIGRSAALADAFWPGPLSLILDTPSWIVADVHAGQGTVAIRVPDHSIARRLANRFGRPITATSANRSGEAPAVAAASLIDLAADRRVLIIDGGVTRGGEPSTLVDARDDPPRCLRAGAIAWDRVLTSR